uniref:Uncharacterized protein n=1 Tax=Quercus lobata TaxID=97700 RepID=A0A7N2L1M8_QUELO
MVNDFCASFMESVRIYCLDVIQLKCEYCGAISPEFRRICKGDLVQNDAHLVERCSDCGKRTGVVTILRQIGVPLKNGIETVVMILDIKEMTPVPNQFDTEFYWTDKSQVTGESSAHFKIEPGQPLDVMCDDGMHGYHGSTNTPMVRTLNSAFMIVTYGALLISLHCIANGLPSVVAFEI